MDMIVFSVVVGFGSMVAGFFGALTGLGGGVLIIPLLTLVFGVDIHYAIGASLISIIATSSGAAAAYVKEGFVNLRLGMFLGIATTVGAIFGAFIAIDTPTQIISVIFGCVLLITTLISYLRSHTVTVVVPPNAVATKLRLNGANYNVAGVPLGFFIMFLAGTLSGLLGIGSGAVKVLALDTVMRLPFKVSTSTSNLMIGVTAAASAGLYLTRGYINPGVVMPVVLGVLFGSFIGASIMKHVKTRLLRQIFAVFMLLIAGQMIYHGIVPR